MKYEIEFSGPLQGGKLLELMKQGYVLRINYRDLEDVKKDFEDGLIDELFADPLLRTLKIVIKNKNFENPFHPRNLLKRQKESESAAQSEEIK